MKRSTVVGFLLFLILAVFLWSIASSRREEFDLGTLLIQDATFPTHWYSGIEQVSTEWEIYQHEYVLPDDSDYYATSNLGRMWQGGDAPGDIKPQRITQHLYYYGNPYRATLRFYLSSPEIAFRGDWPNLDLSYLRDQRYPDDFQYRSRSADQERVICGMGTLESCQLWYYWARYGQYLLSVRVFSPNQGMNQDLFLQVIVPIDAHVSGKLR